MKKNFIGLICIVVLILSSTSSLALDFEKDTIKQMDNIYLTNNGHGEFKFDTGHDEISDLKTDIKVKVKKIDTDIYEIIDTNVLKENIDYNKLVKVNMDTFLRVKELRINLLNANEIEEYINEYEINNEMAKDIRNLSNQAREKDSSISTELIIYTPNFSKTKQKSLETNVITPLALAPQTSYYYVGYNNENYKDEIWFGTNSPTYYTIREGYTTKDYFDDLINNLCEYVISTGADYITGGKYSLVQIFNSNPIITYPAHSGDIWQAALNESKWRKYTSIYMWNDITEQYQYLTRAISDRSRSYFSHYLYRAHNKSKAYADHSEETWTGKHYYETDKYAYLHQDIPYYEYLNRYRVSDWTYFASQN